MSRVRRVAGLAGWVLFAVAALLVVCLAGLGRVWREADTDLYLDLDEWRWS